SEAKESDPQQCHARGFGDHVGLDLHPPSAEVRLEKRRQVLEIASLFNEGSPSGDGLIYCVAKTRITIRIKSHNGSTRWPHQVKKNDITRDQLGPRYKNRVLSGWLPCGFGQDDSRTPRTRGRRRYVDITRRVLGGARRGFCRGLVKE